MDDCTPGGIAVSVYVFAVMTTAVLSILYQAQAGDHLQVTSLNFIEQLVTDWQTKLLIDIKVVDSSKTCEWAFGTTSDNTKELFPNVWQGERYIHTSFFSPLSYSRPFNHIEYSRCSDEDDHNCNVPHSNSGYEYGFPLVQ